MVHNMFAGCCMVDQCGCLGMDGSGPFCDPTLHAEQHNAFVPLPEPKTELERLERRYQHTLTAKDRRSIVSMKRADQGSRQISNALGIPRTLVREVIIQEFGKGPAATPRVRPRGDDRLRALAAGIAPEEFQAERGEGGRARTIDALNAWIAERAA